VIRSRKRSFEGQLQLSRMRMRTSVAPARMEFSAMSRM